ncbi:transposase [Halosquirtibacter laminarini]|uniref:Transposase n=1 Tax=Halosquirtibacter laminarini TaxID=3374600 RepID=A0AC61NBM6_9BACT|nr:transposase [Prolixibacteraceae bacterium]
MKVDASVSDADIRYPWDLNILNDARVCSEAVIDRLWLLTGKGPIKPRTYRKEARVCYLKFAMSKKKGNRKKGCKKQLQYIKRNISTIQRLNAKLKKMYCKLDEKTLEKIERIKTVYDQQCLVLQGKQVKNRIVSFNQDHIRPIVRGKLGRRTEFGAKINVSILNGFARIEPLKWDAYNEGNYLQKQVKSYYDLYEVYPKKIYADKIYLNRKNRQFLEKHHILIIGKPLGRPPKRKEVKDKHRKLQKEMGKRNEVEAFFGVCKRSYGLNKIKAKRQDTSESWIGMICLIFNLRRLLKKFSWLFTIFCSLDLLKRTFLSKMDVIIHFEQKSSLKLKFAF